MDPRDRQEPKVSSPPQRLPEPDYRHIPRPIPNHSGLWLQIALGVFLGMMAHTIVVAAYVKWEAYQYIKALEKQGLLLEQVLRRHSK